MRKSIPILCVLVIGLSACQRPDPTIDRSFVERIITTLAADDMRGRATFTPDIEVASKFLQAEFEKIGLDKMEGLDGYEQAFQMYSLTPGSRTITLNGIEIPDASVFFTVQSENVSWTNEDDIEIVVLGANDDLRTTFSRLREGDTNALVLVDESHSEIFGRYKGFLSPPSRTMELSDGGGLVFILTSETNARSFTVNIQNEISELPLANVIGKIEGRRSDEIVVFSGHYDHIGIRPAAEAGADSIANGANDDASGTAAVVALAKYFKAIGQPERTLIFVAFTAEEMGGYGSRYFSEQLDPDHIVAMFNIEMIGKPAVEGPNTAWLTGFERSSFGEILQQAVEGTEYEFYPDPYPDQNLFYRSDNATLARLGVPAHSISTTPIDVDGDYHQVSDEVETLDMDHMTNTIRAIAKGAVTIISGEATPTRVDTSQLR